MNQCELFVVAVAAGLISGCAATSNQTAKNNDPDDKAYVTGSRIPVKDNGGQAAAAAKAANNPDKGFQDQLRRGSTSLGGVTGAAGQ